MLSVCIPLHNFKAKSLVESLLQGQTDVQRPFEIILIDDGSAGEYKPENRRLQSDRVIYAELPENIGRAGTRNRFPTYARYDYLLFLDCDSVVISKDFLSRYMSEAIAGAKVVCGGRIYDEKAPAAKFRLHWTFGRTRESKGAQVRMLHPYRSFMTNNFMVQKQILEAMPFDERLTGYGHEDTLFGYGLKKKGVSVKHIDNPVLHGVLEENREFLAKTQQGIQNLCLILSFVNNDPAFVEDVTLFRYYFALKKIGCLFPVRLIFALKRPLLKALLLRGYSGCGVFSFYKLGCFTMEFKGRKYSAGV